jgi:hypothetical protein
MALLALAAAHSIRAGDPTRRRQPVCDASPARQNEATWRRNKLVHDTSTGVTCTTRHLSGRIGRGYDSAGSAADGNTFSLHSDASVTPVNPLFRWTATARKTMSGRVLGE